MLKASVFLLSDSDKEGPGVIRPNRGEKIYLRGSHGNVATKQINLICQQKAELLR